MNMKKMKNMSKKNYSKKLFFILLLILIPFDFLLPQTNSQTNKDATTDKNDKNIEIENIKDTLQYGIESEIVSIIKGINKEFSNEYMDLLFSRYKLAQIKDTKIAILNYFSRCEKINPAYVEYLVTEIQDDFVQREIKANIYPVIAKHGNNEQRKLLLEALKNNDRIIQISASTAISKIKDKDFGLLVLERLKKSTESEEFYLSDELRNNLILSLGETNCVEAIPYLKEIVNDSGSEKFSVMYSIYTLGKLNDLSSIDLITKRLKSDDVKIVEYASQALSIFKSETLKDVYLDMLRHNNKNARLYALRGIVNNNFTSLMEAVKYKFLKDPEIQVKNEALKTLISFGQMGIEEIKKITNEKYNYTHYYVVSEKVSQEPTVESVNFLVDLYKKADKNGKEIIAKNIVKGSSNLLDPILSLMLSSEDPMIRVGTINCLPNIVNTTLIPKLIDLKDNDPSPLVKKNANKIYNLMK